MIVGTVSKDRQPFIPLKVKGTSSELDVMALIDTGFNGHVLLPVHIIRELDLSWASQEYVTLGDGSRVTCNFYLGEVEVDGEFIAVTVLAADLEPLVGVALLDGFQLCMDVIDGGTVQLTRLEQSDSEHR